MSVPDDDQLTDAAASIADGGDVEWRRLRERTTGESARVVRELEALEAIALFHRRDDAFGNSTPATATPTEPTSLRRWRHLTLVEQIGSGGSCAVYRAHDANLQTDVALKLVALPTGRTADGERALKEARLLARVRHPHVVRVFGADIADGYVGVWMEHIQGATLASALRSQGPFGAREAALIARDLCQAVAAVHHAGLIHGDIKAHNVMREAGGRTVLMDFGTGKDLRTTAGPLLAASDVAGTPLYLAPEVFRGERRSALTDIYSLGVLVYHLVTDAYPFEGRTQAEVEDAQRRGARKPVRDARPDLPPPLVDIIERATAVDPDRRYASAGTFDAALGAFLAGAHPRPRPRKLWMSIAAGIIVAAVAGAVLYSMLKPSAVSSVPTPQAPGTQAPASYRIATTLYRKTAHGSDRPLRRGDGVSTGDEIYALFTVSAPTYVYIVDEDDNGESYLLFPLPGQAVDNPLAPGAPIRIPGARDEQFNWQVTSVGGREHFLIFASPERLQAFEDLFGTLPRPAIGAPIAAARLPARAIGKLRGVGGITAPAPSAHLANVFVQPLADQEETAVGVFVRQLTVENPPR